MTSTKPPKGPMSLTPHMTVKGAASAIAFYTKVFDAVERYRLTDPTGHIGHAELKIGDGVIYLNDESPAFGALAPPTIGGSPTRLHLYVADVRCGHEKGRGGGSNGAAPRSGSVLRRPLRDDRRSIRPSVVAGYAQRVSEPQRDAAPLRPNVQGVTALIRFGMRSAITSRRGSSA